MRSNFDIAAISYDKTFTNSSIGKAQRMQVYRYLKNVLNSKENQQILEINCGTGEDALYFNSLNHNVLSTDISSEMIQIAKQKNSNNKIRFEVMDLKKIADKNFNTKFDFIFSNFGGLNCLSEEELKRFFASAQKLLKENGKIVTVIMPKNTLWEKLYFSIKGDLKKAKRRNTNKNLAVNVDGVLVNTWYFNPKEIKNITRNLKTIKLKPIGLFVPPSYLQNSILGSSLFIKFLSFLDKMINLSFLAKYADHFYIEMQKQEKL